jgi:hypothetical protein
MSPGPKNHPGSRHVAELLSPTSSGLGELLAVARRLDQLNRKLENLLDPGMGAQVRAAGLREGRLVLVTPSATLATRLRLDAAQIAETLRANGERGVEEIAVRVAPLPQAEPAQRRARDLPSAAQELFERFDSSPGHATGRRGEDPAGNSGNQS